MPSFVVSSYALPAAPRLFRPHRGWLSAMVAASFAAFAPSAVRAQQSLLGPGAGFIAIGVSHVATKQLNDRLASRGYPTFDRNATSIGIGAYRLLSSGVVLGGEFNGLVMGNEAHNGYEVGLGGGSATLGIGYAVHVSPKVRVYPRLGVGVGGLALWFQRRDTVTFNDVLDNPQPGAGREPNLSHDGAVIDIGAGAEFLARGGSGALLGVRAGYLAQSGSSTNWHMYDGTAISGPRASISGFYLRVLLGGGWSR